MFGAKAEIAALEKGLDVELTMVPFEMKTLYQPKHPEVLRINPKRQVPVLIDGDLTLFDSTLIFEYLEDAYPEPPLYPRGAAARARCRLLELTGDEILLPLLRAFMYRSEPANPDPERRRLQEEEAGKAGAEIRREYAKLEARLGSQDYFCGGFSVADIALFMSILFVLRLKGPRLDGHPALAAWHARMLARPVIAAVAAEIAAADRELSPALYR
jgi:glutathione S-transferase